jgi:hypothetical protein
MLMTACIVRRTLSQAFAYVSTPGYCFSKTEPMVAPFAVL